MNEELKTAQLDFLQLRLIRTGQNILIQQGPEQVEVTRPMLDDVIRSLKQMGEQIDADRTKVTIERLKQSINT